MKVWLSSAAIVVAVAGAWLLYNFPPATTTFYPQCMFRVATGLECPGCGTTRALHALLHLRVGEAFALNPMLFAIGVAGLFGARDLVRGRTPRFVMAPWFAWGSLIAITAWWVGRNLA